MASKLVFIVLTIIGTSCNYSNNNETLSGEDSTTIRDTTLKESDLININDTTNSYNDWLGKYATDSLWTEVRESVGASKDDNSYGMYKLIIGKDSTFFSLEIEGQVYVGLKQLSYYCSTYEKNDTLYITTIKGMDDGSGGSFSELNFTPINKPVLKLFHRNGKILGTGINYGKKIDNNHLDIDNPPGDTLEFHKIK